MAPKQMIVRTVRVVLLALLGSTAGGAMSLMVAVAAAIVAMALERLLKVTLVSWEMAGIITALIAAVVGAVAGLIAVAARRPAVGVALALMLHGLAFGYVGFFSKQRPLTVNAWFFAVGLVTGCAAGVAGALIRYSGDALLAGSARREHSEAPHRG